MAELWNRIGTLTWYEHVCFWPWVIAAIGFFLFNDMGRAILLLVVFVVFLIVGQQACDKLVFS